MNDIIWKIWELAVTVLDCIMIVFFLTAYLPLKKKTALAYIISVALLTTVCVATNKYCNMVQSLVVLSIALFIYTVVFIKGKVSQKIFWTLFCQVVFFGVNMLQNTLVSVLVGDTNPSDFSSAGSLRLFNMIFSRFLIAFIIILISKHNFFPSGLTPMQTVLLCLCPTLSCLAMLFLIKLFYISGIDGEQVIGSCVLICTVNFIVFYLFRSLSLQFDALQEKELMLQKVELEEAQYEQIIASAEKLRTWRHDMNNQMISILGLAKQAGAQNVVDYISTISMAINSGPYMITTGNAVIDAIINSKLSRAAEEHIIVDLDLAIPIFDNISDVEVCSIIGNVFDNAIEANIKVKPNDRYINFAITAQKHFGVIFCENASGPVDAKLRTNKPGYDHGIGIKRIKQIIVKYKGVYDFRPSDGRFSVQLLLPIKDVPIKPSLLYNMGRQEYVKSNSSKICDISS